MVRLRREAFTRDGVLVCRPVPLFVVIAHFLGDDVLCEAYSQAIDGGMAEMEDLDPEDEAQAARLETAIFERTTGLLGMRELASVSWWDCDNGPRSVSIIVAYTPQDGLLVIQDHDARVSFQVIAVGCERALQALAADSPELVMPRIGGLGARLREVAIRNDVTWSMSELAGIVNAVTGVHPTEEHVLRGELLHQY